MEFVIQVLTYVKMALLSGSALTLTIGVIIIGYQLIYAAFKQNYDADLIKKGGYCLGASVLMFGADMVVGLLRSAIGG